MRRRIDNFYKKKLKNGLTILFERKNVPVVSISANVKEGFAYENEKQKGISHLAEHLMFKGTKSRSYTEIAKEIESKGGILNAGTSEEYTTYWNKLPNQYFSIGMDIASDLILNPKFDPLEFEKEKKVVLEEIKMYKDNPQLYVFDKIKELLYKKPFGISGIGTMQSVLGLSRDDLIAFHNSNYSTNKMFLCVVGNTTIEEIEEFGNNFPKKFSAIKRISPVRINQELTERRAGIDQANIAFGFHVSTLEDKKRYANEIFNAVLAGGMSSRLFEEIREKRGLAYAVKGILEQGKNFGYQVIYIGTTKDKVKMCKKLILQEIKKMRDLEKSDFEEAKEQLIGLRKVGSEESVSVMETLISEEVAGNAKEYYKYEERVSDVKLEDVKKISKIKNYSCFSLIPKI